MVKGPHENVLWAASSLWAIGWISLYNTVNAVQLFVSFLLTVNSFHIVLSISFILNHIAPMTPKLSKACYAVRLMSHISRIDTLKSIYFAYFHSIMEYGILFWGDSSNSNMTFTLQNRTVRIIAGVKSRNSCRNLFMWLDFTSFMWINIYTNEFHCK
jgi:hypothetical protein